jgi:hypothetical protein
MVRQDLQDFMDFFVFLPSLMEGRKPNPAQGREIEFPPPKGDCAFCLSSGKAKTIMLILSKVFLIDNGNGRTLLNLTPQGGLDELQFRINRIWI